MTARTHPSAVTAIRRPHARARFVALVAAATVGTALLSGCSQLFTQTTPGQQPAPITTTVPSTDAPAPAAYDPTTGTAGNKALWDAINTATATNAQQAGTTPGGSAFIDALAAAGFDRATLEVSADRTSIDLAASSIEFSARFADGCLLGQFGPDDTGYRSIITPLPTSGTCLIGSPRGV